MLPGESYRFMICIEWTYMLLRQMAVLWLVSLERERERKHKPCIIGIYENLDTEISHRCLKNYSSGHQPHF